jgi:hypothetical protein
MSNLGRLTYHIADPNSSPSDGVFSFANQTNITVNIAENQNAFLVGSSMKLCFKLVLKDGADVQATAGECHLSANVGCQGLFNQVDVFSYETNKNLSSLRSYNRVCSSVLSNGVCDMNDVIQSQSHAGIGMSQDQQNTNVGVYTSTGVTSSDFQSYCIRPMVGSIMANDFYLGSVISNGVGGLKVNFTLQPNSNAITNDSAPGGTPAEYSYELSEVKLVYATRIGTPDEIRATRLRSNWESKYTEMIRNNENRGVSREELETNWARVVNSSQEQGSVYKYKDFNAYLNTIQSDNHNISLNLGLRKCNGVIVNTIPSSAINSTTVDDDGNRQYPLEDTTGDEIPYKAVGFTKGSELFPSKFIQNNNTDVNYTDDTLDYTVDRQAVTKKNLLDSVVSYPENDYQRGAVFNSLYETQYSVGVNDDKLSGNFGVGSGKNSVTGGSSDYMFSSLGINLNSQNLGTFSNNSAFVIAHYDSEISINNAMIDVSF